MSEPIAELAERYRSVRAATERLAEPLAPEDCTPQSMPDASPVKWHLAHTSWFFETFVLERETARYHAYHTAFRVLFNSYYQSVGAQHARHERGLVTRPGLAEVRAYREHVDRHMLALLDAKRLGAEAARVVELGLHHEQQHQELILTDVKHLLWCNPLRPAYHKGASPPAREAGGLEWWRLDEGVGWAGYDGQEFAFDNESPRHRVLVGPCEIATRPATNAEFRAFIDDGGYARPELWLSDGWESVRRHGWTAPLYWERGEEGWRHFTLAGTRALAPEEPVCHVSFYEADAYARWAGARLPSEAEWETACTAGGAEGHFVEEGVLHPVPAGAAASRVPRQMLGDVWEWTASAYAAYPGYRPPAGALGEYNGKFMCNQLVLRGGSCATPRSHIRPTYRNFFYPDARWQFSGIRLARDI